MTAHHPHFARQTGITPNSPDESRPHQLQSQRLKLDTRMTTRAITRATACRVQFMPLRIVEEETKALKTRTYHN